MNIPPMGSALNLINTAQTKASEAAHTIATLPVDKEEVGGINDFSSDELFKPVMQLKEAEIETQAAVKIIQTDEDMKDSLFDAFA